MHSSLAGRSVRGRSLQGEFREKKRASLVLMALPYSAQGFLTFMSGYTVFLGPFAGIMVTDVRTLRDNFLACTDIPSQYWLVHRGRVDVPAMYDPHGRYRYSFGFVGLNNQSM